MRSVASRDSVSFSTQALLARRRYSGDQRERHHLISAFVFTYHRLVV